MSADYTANAGTYLVNNQFIDPNATPGGSVPAPSTLLLLAIGLLSLAQSRLAPRRA
jgi:hypothetical protein